MSSNSTENVRVAIQLTNVSTIYRFNDLFFDAMLRISDFFRKNKEPKQKRFKSLDGISLTIKTGEIVGIIGRNGAGKTTLLKLISGNIFPVQGELKIEGKIQALSSGFCFKQKKSGYQNLKSFLHYQGLSGDQLANVLEEAIDLVELGKFLHQPMKTYSIGMKLRLQFIVAILIKPDILVIDEMLDHLDEYFSRKYSALMKNLASSGTAVLLASNSTSKLSQLCERVIWLENGRIALDSDADLVIKKYKKLTENYAKTVFINLYRWPFHDGLKISKHEKNKNYNILILYDPNSMHVGTIFQHLASFRTYSKHEVFYAAATGTNECNFDLSLFDIIVIHYSIRLSIENHLSVEFSDALKKFQGCKIAFVQDEYDCTEITRQWIESLSIQILFTCVPSAYINNVYPVKRFPKVTFIQTLTGYVPIDYERLQQYIKPMHERRNLIGHRARHLPYWYGNLGREKYEIASKMKEICDVRSIPNDIEWAESKRIYGENWLEFISKNKVTLGTESGANVFDEVGLLRKNIEDELKTNPSVSYEEIFDKYLKEHEGKLAIMNQISPRIFESIAVKCALLLFEGNYSNILTPNVHYIPLKKDFSNIEGVFSKLNDSVYLENMVETAYKDIILSGKYSYQNFILDFDNVIEKHKPVKGGNIKSILKLLELDQI